jgi:hypothetical protein
VHQRRAGPQGLGPEPSRGAALAERIVETGQGSDWYGSLELADGRPHVEVYSAGSNGSSDLPGGHAKVYMVHTASDSPADEACNAIAAVVNDPAYGSSLSLTEITMLRGSLGTVCYPPQKP